MFDTTYVLVHNGVLYNEDDLKQQHDKLGIKYTSVQHDKSFNDSEGLLWDFALYMEGKQDKMLAEGSIAFIALAIRGDHRELYFSRNMGSPLYLKDTSKQLSIASEGEGDSVPTDKLFKFDLETRELTDTDLVLGTGYSSYTYGGYSNGYVYNDDDFVEGSTGNMAQDISAMKGLYMTENDHNIARALASIENDLEVAYYDNDLYWFNVMERAYNSLAWEYDDMMELAEMYDEKQLKLLGK